jgi:hypothetical protein
MNVTGYMIDVQWDGETLRVHGKNKAARVALAGEDHATDVVVPREEIVEVKFRDASALVNGQLTVSAADGRKYRLHFRRKQRNGFRELGRALGADVPA